MMLLRSVFDGRCHQIPRKVTFGDPRLEAWKSDSVAIYCASALFAPFGRMLESRFCRYLLCFRSLCCFCVPAGKHILLLFAVLPLSLLLLGAGWTAYSVAICGASALLVRGNSGGGS